MTIDELMDGWEAAWSGRDPAAFSAVCHPEDFHYEDPLTAEPFATAEDVGRHAERLWTGFPDARLERTGKRLTDGRFVAAPVKVVATHRGPLEGLPPSGRFLVVHVIAYCEVRDGRLFRVRTFFDLYGAAVQLGILPRPGTLGERALLMLRGFGLRRD